jgi:hypothetical protein
MPMASAAAIAVLRPDQVGGLRAGAEAGGVGSSVPGAEAADPELAVREGAGTGAGGIEASEIEATAGTGAAGTGAGPGAGTGAGGDPTRSASSTAYGAVTVVAQIGWVASGAGASLRLMEVLHRGKWVVIERRVDGCGRAVARVSGD